MKIIKQIFSACKNSYFGLKFLLKERAFVQELVVFFMLSFILFYFCNIPNSQKMYVILAQILVLIVESINTAIEKTIDRIGTEYNELSKIVKDVASFAVFLSILHLVVCVVWILVGVV